MVPLISFRSLFKRSLLTVAGLAILLNIAIPVAVVNAAAPSAFSDLDTQTERWMRMRGMYGCLYEKGLPYNSSDQVIEGHFANNGSTAIGYLNEDGKVSCDDGDFVTNSNEKIGFKGNDYSYCAAQPSSYRTGGPDTGKTSDVEGCIGGSGSYNNAAGHETIAKEWLSGLRSQVPDYAKFMTDSGGQRDESKYYMYYKSLLTFCGASKDSPYGGSAREKSIVEGDKKKIVINYVTPTGEIEPTVFKLTKDQDDKVDDVYQELNSDSKDLSCEFMAERTWELDTATANWVKAYNIENPDAPTDELELSTDPSEIDAGSTCALEGMGWLICPAVRIIATFNDALFGMINNLLDINPSLFEREGKGAAIYNAWEGMRNIANVAFVIAFMVVIYSQITSVGISNYGIKKLLPRMMVAAILVNLSYVVCALAVDLSNIIGMASHDLMIDQAKNLGDSAGQNLDMWDGIMTFLLGGAIGSLAIGSTIIAAGGVSFMALLALFIPLAVVALLAALTVLFILVAREAFIIILVALSPLAFVAYLLPNTEQWFARWRKTFFSMLLIYPMISVLFGGSQLASAVIRAGAEDALTYVLSLVVLVVPLFATPLLLKLSGSLIGRVAGMLNNPNKGPFDRLKKAGVGYAERKNNFNMENQVKRTEGIRSGEIGRGLGGADSKRRRTAAWLSGIGNTNAFDKDKEQANSEIARKAAERNYVADRVLADPSYAAKLAGGNEKMVDDIVAYAISDVEKARKEDRDVQRTIMIRENLDFKTLSTNIKSGAYAGNRAKEEAAMQRFFELSNSDGVQDMINHVGDSTLATKAMAGADGAPIDTAARADYLRKMASESLTGHGLKPVDLSASSLTRLKNGQDIGSEGARIASTIGEGKTTSSHIGNMDIDEMRRWNKQMEDDPSLLINSSEEVIAATREAIEAAETDKRINVKFGDRERKALEEMKSRLSAAEAASAAAKATQNAAASSYGPGI